MSDWLEVQVQVRQEQAELIEDWLFASGALSVTLDSADLNPEDALNPKDDLSQAILEPGPGELPLWQRVRLTGLFARETDAETLALSLHLAAVERGMPLPDHQFHRLMDQAWERSWLDRFQPMQFGEQFWLCPTHSPAVDPDAITLRLDPGLAFGTGTHPTTALCLQWLGERTAQDKQPLAGKKVIDFGCGSGVLAIASLLLGAEHAWAVDIDDQALIASRENGQINNVSDRLSIGSPQILEAVSADILIANILFQPLVDLAETFAGLVNAGGSLVLSGILEDQIQALRMSYNPWYADMSACHKDGWARLHAIRQPALCPDV